MEFVTKLDNKVLGLKNLAQYAGKTSKEVLEPYNYIIDDTTINKQQLFRNLLLNKTNTQEYDYINKVCNLPHRDNRTPTEYATELVITWLMEDITSLILTDNQIRNRINGADKERNFLPPHQIDEQTDLQIKQNGETRNLETIYDHTGHWDRTQQIDLRLNKHNNLKKQDALLLGINPRALTAVLIDYRNPIESHQRENQTYGKVVNTITITRQIKPLQEIIQQLK
jgi:hypothetical protein